MFTLCFGLLFIKGFFCLKITTPREINATLNSNSSIILNCTYELEAKDDIRNVLWKKKILHEDYKDLVEVTKTNADYTADGFYLINRSDLHRFSNSSTSVALIIKHVRCIDNGHYQCFIKYHDGVALKTVQNNTAVNLQADAKKPTNFSVQPNNNLKENELVIFSCVGDVGNPQGFLAIWKTNKKSNPTQLFQKYEVFFRY